MAKHKIEVKNTFLITQTTIKTILLNDLKNRPTAYHYAIPKPLEQSFISQTVYEIAKSGKFDRIIATIWDNCSLLDCAADIIQLSWTDLKMEYCPNFCGRAINCQTRQSIDIGHSNIVFFTPSEWDDSRDWDSLIQEYAVRLSKFLGTDFPFENHIFDITGEWHI